MDQGNNSGPNMAAAQGLAVSGPEQVDVPNTSRTEPTPDRLDLRQQAYLLEQLAAQAAASRPAAELNKKITKGAKLALELDAKRANEIRVELAKQGYLQATKAGRSLSYAVTDAGRAYLAGLERHPLPGRAKTATAVDDATFTPVIRDGQNAFLLLQLLDAKVQPLGKGEANKIKQALQTSLGLKPAVANFLRAKLAERGYLRIVTAGRSEAYSLTPDGLEYLATDTRHLEHGDFTLKGKTLNALVTAARESSFERDRPTAVQAPTEPAQAPGQRELEDAVLAEFEELRREHHGRSGLVPIHEVRQRIVERFGPAAGRHSTLDEVILGLWRQQRLGLEGISDLGKATSQQLNDGIPGVSGTLFYLEAPREQPVAP